MGMQDHFPRIVASLKNRSERALFVWRFFFTWVKLLMIHVVLAVLFFNGPFNGFLIRYFSRDAIAKQQDINSWTFLVNCVLQGTSIIGFLGVFIDSVLIYEKVSNRIIGASDPNLSILWRSRMLNLLTTI